MRIVSLNVNGIRAAVKKGLAEWWQSVDGDILLLQEVRFDQKAFLEKHFPGYYCYLHTAAIKGYSGVAILSRKVPKQVVDGIGNPRFDKEGRVIRIDFEEFSIVNGYFPSGAARSERQDFKLEFLESFGDYLDVVHHEILNVIVGADWNMCHREKDIHNPIHLAGTPGFSVEERRWLDGLEHAGWRDAFRLFSIERDAYTWWSHQSRSRERNVGWRIDGFWMSPTAVPGARRCVHLSKAVLSDHCPVLLEWELPTTFG